MNKRHPQFVRRLMDILYFVFMAQVHKNTERKHKPETPNLVQKMNVITQYEENEVEAEDNVVARSPLVISKRHSFDSPKLSSTSKYSPVLTHSEITVRSHTRKKAKIHKNNNVGIKKLTKTRASIDLATVEVINLMLDEELAKVKEKNKANPDPTRLQQKQEWDIFMKQTKKKCMAAKGKKMSENRKKTREAKARNEREIQRWLTLRHKAYSNDYPSHDDVDRFVNYGPPPKGAVAALEKQGFVHYPNP